MEMVFLVENMNFVVGMESLVEIHNYLDMVTLELVEVEGIRRLLVAEEVMAVALVEVVTATAVVDTLTLLEVEVVEVGMDSHTQHTLCMELGLLLLMK